MRTGGGSKRLFRKIGDRASQFYKNVNKLRRDGSFIYEEFLSTGGTDIKVYTCGPNYAHAEARKAPTLDGKVQRDANNKERRFPIVLNMFEKLIARKVVLAFGMNVCGFDILKSKNKSFVCDVNGFSFVKSSTKYYDDAAIILCDLMLQAMGRDHVVRDDADDDGDDDNGQSTHQGRRDSSTSMNNNGGGGGEGGGEGGGGGEAPPSPGRNNNNRMHRTESEELSGGGMYNTTRTTPSHSSGSKSFDSGMNDLNGDNNGLDDSRELRCVVAVVRHGDRTPKEKMKMNVTNPLWMEFFKC